jgi:hypothetical protein
VPFDNFQFVLALVILLTACVAAAPNAAPPPQPAKVAGKQAAIADDVAVQRAAPIFCVNRKTFAKAVQNERLRFFGVIPKVTNVIVEIYSGGPGGSGFTIAVRDANQDEVCIMLSGSDLVPVHWSTPL